MKRLIGLYVILTAIFFIGCGEDKASDSGGSYISGLWVGTISFIEDPEGPYPLHLSLSERDDSITGSMTFHEGESTYSFAILDFEIVDNNVSFRIDEMEDEPDQEPEYWNFSGTTDLNTMSGTFASEITESERGMWSVTKE